MAPGATVMTTPFAPPSLVSSARWFVIAASGLAVACGESPADGRAGSSSGGTSGGTSSTAGGRTALGGSATSTGGRGPGTGGSALTPSGGRAGGGAFSGGGAPSSGGRAPAGGSSANGGRAQGASGASTSGGASTAGASGTGGSVTGGSGGAGPANGGAASGNGGTAPSGGTGGESPSAAAYPCDGTTDGYDAVVTQSGSSWSSKNGDRALYSGGDMLLAMQAAIDSLSAGRTSKESVLVQGSGTVSATTRLNLASYTVLNVCGTIEVTGAASGDNAPIYARGRTDIEVPNVTISGTPAYAIFFRNVNNLHLGKVVLSLSSGLGIRVDNHGGDRNLKATNLRIDDVHVEGASDQGVETYGVDGVVIGRVVARDVGYSGLLLNDTVNVEVGLVDGDNVAAGQGYAVFRMANRNGRLAGGYESNVHVRKVIARGGGRGIFCVSESGGAVIDEVDLEGTGNNSILLENCYNVTIGSPDVRSRIASSGELRLAARSEFANNSDITIQNIAVNGTAVREDPCAEGSEWIDVDTDSTYSVCD